MTIRSGGGPRDPRTQARPYDDDAYATESMSAYPDPARSISRGPRDGGRGSHGVLGLLKFLVFALVLGASVLLVAFTALRPVVNGAVLSVAEDNPAALQLPFVKDMVREDLGASLTTPISADATQVQFLVEAGDTARTIGDRLEQQGLLSDSRTFVFISIDRGLSGSLQQGTFVLRKNMTPDQLVSALLTPPAVPYVDIALRTGLRLEQITAKLQSLTGLDMDAKAFHDLVKSPPPELIADYPWLQKILANAPKGSSLEGFLWPATYRVLPDTTPEELVRLMLDNFVANVGADRLNVPNARGLDFYQILVLASIVDHEAQLDEEKPLIAGVYQNRLDPKKWPTGRLESDPTIFYVNDSLSLAAMPVSKWPSYVFWAPFKGGLTADLPADLAGYNTYTSAGLPPGPLCTPTVTSIDAALEPNTTAGYLYFLAKGDGSKTTAFAKTYAQHQANIKKYLKP